MSLIRSLSRQPFVGQRRLEHNNFQFLECAELQIPEFIIAKAGVVDWAGALGFRVVVVFFFLEAFAAFSVHVGDVIVILAWFLLGVLLTFLVRLPPV